MADSSLCEVCTVTPTGPPDSGFFSTLSPDMHTADLPGLTRAAVCIDPANNSLDADDGPYASMTVGSSADPATSSTANPAVNPTPENTVCTAVDHVAGPDDETAVKPDTNPSDSSIITGPECVGCPNLHPTASTRDNPSTTVIDSPASVTDIIRRTVAPVDWEEIIRTNYPDLLKNIDTKNGLEGEFKKRNVFSQRSVHMIWVRMHNCISIIHKIKII